MVFEVAGNVPGASTAPPDEDATTSAYRGLHDQAVAEYTKFETLARQAAAAGNDPSPFVRSAQEYFKIANDISLKSIEASKPKDDRTGEIKNYEYSKSHPDFAQPKDEPTEVVHLNDGTFQTINKKTGALIGVPVGHPSEAPRPVTDEERKTYGLPETGAARRSRLCVLEDLRAGPAADWQRISALGCRRYG